MKILVAGDFCPRYRVSNLIDTGNNASVLEEVISVTDKADYSVVNLECPVVTGKAQPIAKLGPNLRCSPQGVKALQFSGFDCVTLANNHFMDYGFEGASETLATLDAIKVDHVGGGKNIAEASSTLFKAIGDQRLAIINCCEHEFSIATENKAGSNPLNPIQQYYAIQDAKAKADHVLVIVHGGHEHFQLPSFRMVEIYHFFIDAGADVVVNHHQHCYSGYEQYKGGLIFYGLGNLCFDNPAHHQGIWTEGYMVTIDFSSENTHFEIHPYQQCTATPMVKLLVKDAFKNRIDELNAIIEDKVALQTAIGKYYESCSENYSNLFEPIFNRYYLAAKRRLGLPSMVSLKRKLCATNFILCEAHRDKLAWWLEHE